MKGKQVLIKKFKRYSVLFPYAALCIVAGLSNNTYAADVQTNYIPY